MIRSFPEGFSLFRPTGGGLAPETKTQIQLHRLLSLLGVVLVPLFGLLYDVSNPEATDPMWARLAVGGLFAALFAASYVSGRIRRTYVAWMRGVLYVLMGWFVIITTLNGFAVDYVVGLLLVYAVLAAVVGLGAQRIEPVLWFLATGLVLTTGGVVLATPFRVSPLILFACMGTLALVGSITIWGLLETRRKMQRRSDAIEAASDGIAILNSEGVYTYVNQAHAEIYGYDSPEAFLGETWKICYGEEETRRFEKEVEDTGIGIDEEAIPQVFQAFRQESEGMAREYEGPGVGLSIVQELTNALGGEIEVESEKGEGTAFTVRLPIRKAESERREALQASGGPLSTRG